MTLSPAVAAFAEAMQSALDAHADKGNIMTMLPGDALAAAAKNLAELSAAGYSGRDPVKSAVDVANYLMVVAVTTTKDTLRPDDGAKMAAANGGITRNNNPAILAAASDEPLLVLRSGALAAGFAYALADIGESIGMDADDVRRYRVIGTAMRQRSRSVDG